MLNPLKHSAHLLNYCRVFALLFCASAQSLGAEPSAPQALPDTNPDAQLTSPSNTADEAPMMLYVVPWNANPESNKNGKKITLYKPWGVYFDPLTPAQTAQLNTP
jgi:hypothetical protein